MTVRLTGSWARSSSLGVAAAAAALAFGLAGCSPSAPAPSQAPSNGGSSDSPQPSGPATTTKGKVTPGPKNDVERRRDVTLTNCEAADGGWKASGTINNTSDSSHEYSITVYFTTDKATDLGSAKTSVTVPANEKMDWSATGKFKAAKKTLCVLGPIT